MTFSEPSHDGARFWRSGARGPTSLPEEADKVRVAGVLRVQMEMYPID